MYLRINVKKKKEKKKKKRNKNAIVETVETRSNAKRP